MKRINSIVLHIKILLALAVFFSANAFSNPNDKFLKLAKQNYINGEYAEGDFHIARYMGHPDANANNVRTLLYWLPFRKSPAIRLAVSAATKQPKPLSK